jgi:hypothetical protein
LFFFDHPFSTVTFINLRCSLVMDDQKEEEKEEEEEQQEKEKGDEEEKTESQYIEEACFYLSELREPPEKIAMNLGVSLSRVAEALSNYREKIRAKNLRESSGDERITMVDDKGRYYHGWRSELERLPTQDLIELLVVNKQYSDKHPLSEFSKTQPVVGYDPIVPLRNIRRTVALIDQILQERDAKERERRDRARARRRSRNRAGPLVQKRR